MEGEEMKGIFVNPEEVKYLLSNGRYITVRKILGKIWRRSHLVWCWANQVSLEILQRFLDQGYIIHHINDDTTDDRAENLMIIKKGAHSRLHSSGEKSFWWGKTFTAEIRKKMSESKRGEKNPMWGKTHTLETRRKISESQKGEKCFWWGKTPTAEHRRKLSESFKGEKNPMWGKTHTLETRRKISESNRGKTHTLETRRKMSQIRKGKTLTAEHCRKISEALRGEKNPMRGRTHTLETRQKMSHSQKNRWRERRGDKIMQF